MLTIFCSPKPFIGETAWNQLNAFRSWRAIHRELEIFVFGAPRGAEEASAEINAFLIPEIECSTSGAPSFNAMAAYVRRHGRYDLQVYVNCDILLNETLIKAMTAAHHRFGKFLLVGERLDLQQTTKVDVREKGWVQKIQPLTEKEQLNSHGPTGADYFGFVRGLWKNLPPVFMGRAMCDQALLHYSLKRRIPLIDATLAVLAIHQNHDYQHVAGGHAYIVNGDDRNFMAKAHGLRYSLPTIADTDWRFGATGIIEPNRKPRHSLRRIELAFRYRLKIESAALVLRLLQRMRGKSGVVPLITPARAILTAWQSYQEANGTPLSQPNS